MNAAVTNADGDFSFSIFICHFLLSCLQLIGSYYIKIRPEGRFYSLVYYILKIEKV